MRKAKFFFMRDIITKQQTNKSNEWNQVIYRNEAEAFMDCALVLHV